MCECDKACDVGEYLDYENFKCRKKLIDKLVDECTETVEELRLAKITFVKNFLHSVYCVIFYI